ncbi:hypothetical protein AK812_SmicGene2612 [Symbiodinium microadriaticum]|uniref:Uncharacterized protein n=1 Tax=Symbiodinium microadriaticum TaxID=2951 RepID=A0A1Q9F0Z2_SYMMI|nr:hypothetical protein AK812_SmicGene2612 [Symbiodinium microadriaticum]
MKYCMHGQSSSAVAEACDPVVSFVFCRSSWLRPRVRGTKMLAVGHWAVVLLVVAADEDCSLLVVNSTMGHRMYTKDGYCAQKAGDSGTTLENNVLEFEGTKGATLYSVQFTPKWYAFPPGQPIRKDCATYDGTKLTFRVGRRPSEDVRDEFMSGANKSSILKSRVKLDWKCDQIPEKLNFVFEGLATFVFRHGDGWFGREVTLRFAQGHNSGKAYNWWMGSPETCHCPDSDNPRSDGLVCRELGFFPYKGPNNHKFYVYPRPI